MTKVQEVSEFCDDMRLLAANWGANLFDTLELCAVELRAGVRKNFDEEHASDGTAWVPRKDEGFTHPLLNESGSLKRAALGEGAGSVYNNVGTYVELGVDPDASDEGGIPGGRVHQYGATIRPVRAKFLSWINSAGERVFARQVTIPARPYMGISTETADKCVGLIADRLVKDCV